MRGYRKVTLQKSKSWGYRNMDAFLFLRILQVGLGGVFTVLLGCFWEALRVTLAPLGGLVRSLVAPFYENYGTLVARRKQSVRQSLCGALCYLLRSFLGTLGSLWVACFALDQL